MARSLTFAVGLADDDISRFLDSDSDGDDDVGKVPPLHRATTLAAPPPPITLLTATAWRGPEQTDPSGDASRLVPPSRWDVDVGWPGESVLPKRFGSFVEGAELFDRVFFAVSTTEAMAMDAQQRLLLEGCWEALGASALGASSITDAAAARAVAVGVGVSYTEYYLNAASQGMTALSATSGSLSVVCGRVSFALGLKGPSLSVDTACSSSLVVAHLAATSFLPGGCRRALAAGVNLTVRAETTAVLSKAGMLAVDGRCKTLDAAADGYMRGEACVAHLLEAATSGDLSPRGAMEAAVLLGTPVNQDGRSSSLTAPNGPSQQAVIRAALERAGVPALDIGTLEMHGTGTALGDPIEVGAAFVMLQASGRAPLELHAAKSRLLHAEPAAGAVGLAQLVLRLGQMGRHHNLHLHAINPHVASPLMEAGLDSIGSIGLRNALISNFGVDAPATVAFDYPTIEGLAGFVLHHRRGSIDLRNTIQDAFDVDLPGPITFDHPTPAALADYIAVRHMLPLAVTAHPWPGDSSVIAPPSCAPSHTKLTEIVGWSAAVAGNGQPDTTMADRIYDAAECVTPVPLERWDLETPRTDEEGPQLAMPRFAAWLDNVADFDGALFRLSRPESQGLDPQSRKLLEGTWMAVQDATPAITANTLATTGVFVGCVWSEYMALQDGQRLQHTVATRIGSGLTFLAGRVSFTFGFQALPPTWLN
ncbi:polyketide synthase [Micractinium conductrix]|uniref:Polyketide synthase n=1 Tax=Micractinium conductrix TaxID=554055 RepID=A0A2P6V0T1_9CHLO|nr:polyketide synthase [Micractinium conductrix]|eukprot:PSC67706.1 polyketide synthase [Micractinium conductrix]